MDEQPANSSPRAELAAKLKAANNILVTVSRNPSVDQLAACLGLTLVLNKLDKHTAAVFSGQVPSTLEFLQPEETLEKNTDSLRDFIIALDKSKADKLRYKVEDNVVRIFITPYRTSITQDDLNFSQGDFNVDVVVALGVQSQEDIDEAITSHGRILHDATVATINTGGNGELGGINWLDANASSLSEMVSGLAQDLGKTVMDSQIATALLTGIVAETARFSNEKTTPQTMTISSALMAAGANQQLVASKLEQPPETDGQAAKLSPKDGPTGDGGTLDIDHPDETGAELPAPAESEVPEPEVEATNPTDFLAATPLAPPSQTDIPQRVTEPPALGGTLTANTAPPDLEPSTDPLSLPVLEHNQDLVQEEVAENPLPMQAPTITPAPVSSEPTAPVSPEPTIPMPTASVSPAVPEVSVPGLTPPPPAWVPPNEDPLNIAAPTPDSDQTLAEIESSVGSPHVSNPSLDSARDEVNKALGGTLATPEPVQALNAQPMVENLNTPPPAPAFPTPPAPTAAPLPPVTNPAAPPPVPPPFNFQPPAGPAA